MLGKLDVLIVGFGDRRIANRLIIIDCDYDRLVMGITAQCLPIGFG